MIITVAKLFQTTLRANLGTIIDLIEVEEGVTLTTPASASIVIGEGSASVQPPTVYIIPMATREITSHRQWTARSAGYKTFEYNFGIACDVRGNAGRLEEVLTAELGYYAWAIGRCLEETYPEVATGTVFDFRVLAEEYSPTVIDRLSKGNQGKLHKAVALHCTARERVGIGTTART